MFCVWKLGWDPDDWQQQQQQQQEEASDGFAGL